MMLLASLGHALQNGTDPAAASAASFDPGFWLAAASCAALLVVAVGVWALDVHLREVRDEARRLHVLEELDQKLGRLLSERGDLDLRRLEHALIDLRDGQRRLEDATLELLQRALTAAPTANDALVPVSAESVGERITNRLLALGFERIQLVSSPEELAALAKDDGEVLIEARKEGALHKGRVIVRGGRIADVDTNPAYSIFP